MMSNSRAPEEFQEPENTYVAAFERIAELRQDALTIDELIQAIVDTARTITGAKYAALGIITPDQDSLLDAYTSRYGAKTADERRTDLQNNVGPSVVKAINAQNGAAEGKVVQCPFTGVMRRVSEDKSSSAYSSTVRRDRRTSQEKEESLNQFITKFIHSGLPDSLAALIGPHPEGHGLLGEIISKGETIVTNNVQEHPSSYGVPKWHPKLNSFIGTPVRIDNKVYGNLYVAESESPQGFNQVDVQALRVLADQAGVAIQFAYMDSQLKRAVLQDERSRIARDLHDGVMQSLFSIGMGLQALSMETDSINPEISGRINSFVDLLDDTVQNIRATIYRMRDSEETVSKDDLNQGVVLLAREYEANCKIRPNLDLSTRVNSLIPDSFVPDILFFIREALSNITKHSKATRIRVVTKLQTKELPSDETVKHNMLLDTPYCTISILDNGEGFNVSKMNAGHGLMNMKERANLMEAELLVDSAPGKGTNVTLFIPLREQAA